MSVLFNLPDELIVSVLCEFLATRSLGNLDSSLCTSKCRASYLQTVRNPFFVTKGFGNLVLNKRADGYYFQWLMLRKCQVASLVYSERWNEDDNGQYMPLDQFIRTSKITSLTICGTVLTTDEIFNAIPAFSNVTTLSLNSTADSVITAVATNCLQLKDIILPFRDYIETNNAFKLLVKNCTNLRTFSGSETDAVFLTYLMENCVSLEEVQMWSSRHFTLEVVCKVLSRKPMLKVFGSFRNFFQISAGNSVTIRDHDGQIFTSVEDLRQIPGCDANINKLTLHAGAGLLTDSILSYIMQQHPELTHFKTPDTSSLSDEAIASIAAFNRRQNI